MKLKTGGRKGWEIWSLGLRFASDFDIRILNFANHIKHLANSCQERKSLNIIP
jgi:hypothetical protein